MRDEEATVGPVIASVVAQTRRNLEALATGWAACDVRVRVLSNPRRLPNTALNVGPAASRGAYFTRVAANWAVNDVYVGILEQRPEVAAIGGRRNGMAAPHTIDSRTCIDAP